VTTRPAPSDDEILSWGARCSVEQAAWALGMGHNQARAAIKRRDFPVPWFKVGRRYVVPTAPLRALLRIDQPSAEDRHDQATVRPLRAQKA
jgi:hypothetical protein